MNFYQLSGLGSSPAVVNPGLSRPKKDALVAGLPSPGDVFVRQSQNIRFGITAASAETASSVSEVLSTIPQKDLEILKRFFEKMFVKGDLGYTLYGEKPLSIIKMYDKGPDYAAYVVENEWQIWKKYESRLPLNDAFVFRVLGHPAGNVKTDSGDTREVALFNREATIATIEKNLDLFRIHLQDDGVNAQAIWNRIINDQETQDLILENEVLLGILLGYGRENAIAFARLQALEDKDQSDRPYRLVARQDVSPLPEYSSSQEELEALARQLRLKESFEAESAISFLYGPFVGMVVDWDHRLPIFVSGKPDAETQRLLDSYYDTYQDHVSELYAERNVMEHVLERLTVQHY